MAGCEGAGGCGARVTFGFGAICMQPSANPRDLPERAGGRGLGVHEDLHEDLCEIYVSYSARCAGDLGSPRRILRLRLCRQPLPSVIGGW